MEMAIDNNLTSSRCGWIRAEEVETFPPPTLNGEFTVGKRNAPSATEQVHLFNFYHVSCHVTDE